MPKAKSKAKSKPKAKSTSDAATPDDALFRVGIALSVIRSRFETVSSVAVCLEDSGSGDAHPIVAIQAVAEKGVRECNEAMKTIEQARKQGWRADEAAEPRRRAADALKLT